MSKEKMVMGTLFIDMKYVILYRKLGFLEIKPDIFEKKYSGIEILIESEKQRFLFKKSWYPLVAHKDFVILECIDRLLKKGYEEKDIEIGKGSTCDIVISNGQTRVNVRCEQWGEDYDNCAKNLHADSAIFCLYTSKLAGGLIDSRNVILVSGERFCRGIFERDIKPFRFLFTNIQSPKKYNPDFLVENDTLVKYLGHERNVVIPEGIVKIETGAFWSCTFIDSIVIPDTTTCIGGDAFIYCRDLKKINIPRYVDQMGDDPFAGCDNLSITNESPYFIWEDGVLFSQNISMLIHYNPQNLATTYEIPFSVDWIGKHSFYKCNNLEKVIISKSVKFMGNNVFSDCEKLTLENHSPYFVYENGALYNAEKTTVIHYSMGYPNDILELANTVRTVGRNSFWNCRRLKKIIIPPSVRQVGYNPFASCVNLEIENHSSNYIVEKGILYDKDQKELICCTSKAAKEGVAIPPSVLNIGRNSFCGCESLKELIIPQTVKTIGRGAFSECINLEKIFIPHTVESIGEWAFSGCKKMTYIEIPRHILIIANVFNGCDAKVIRV